MEQNCIIMLIFIGVKAARLDECSPASCEKGMAYADITRNDRNPLKRYVQRRRLADALQLVPATLDPRTVVDFGAGDGALCQLLALSFARARILCFEPSSTLRAEAVENLRDILNVSIIANLDELPHKHCDLLFCLEVFEHLPAPQTVEAIRAIKSILSEEGMAVIGVPIELFWPALVKGLFRMARRHGEYDAGIANIVRATAGVPPRDRPVAEIAPGLPYHFHHLGFDHRCLRAQLEAEFEIVRTRCSPCRWLGAWGNLEIYYLLKKRPAQQATRSSCWLPFRCCPTATCR
jgi:SAM-dependent methyltransferase